MSWGKLSSYPRAIIHIDGDSFFASCEVAKNPLLRGKPVITGRERGIVSACTYEAKARGVTRAMKIHEALAVCPDAIVLPSDYETYSLFSKRMYAIVRRYTPVVEEYSIDECFAEITGLRHVKAGFGHAEAGMRRANHMSYLQMAQRIKHELDTELGMTFSIGLAPTKVLAKIGSKWKKPSGLTAIPLREVETFLNTTSVAAVWGIGPNTAAQLRAYRIYTALDFAKTDEAWVKQHLSKPFHEIWRELNGEMVYEVDREGKETYQSISKTKTFTPPSTDSAYVFSQLSKNIENACIKARHWGLVTPEIFFFLKTQDFKFHGFEIKLSHPTSVPHDIVRMVARYYPQVFEPRTRYRATGITLMKLAPGGSAQLDLFGSVIETEGIKHIFDSVDGISERYGKHAVFLASSLRAMTHAAHRGARGDAAERVTNLFVGETKRRRLAIPMLGEVG